MGQVIRQRSVTEISTAGPLDKIRGPFDNLLPTIIVQKISEMN